MLNRGNLAARRSLLVLTAAAAALAAFSPLVAAPSGPSPRAGEIVERLRRIPPGPEAASRQEALDQILEGSPYPGSCATPLILSLQQARPALEGRAGSFLGRLGPARTADPSLVTSTFHPSPGSFRVRAAAAERGLLALDDGDLDGIPDEATRLIDRLEIARQAVLAVFDQSGMPPSPSDAEEPVHDVEIANLPGNLAGYVWSGDGPPVLILDPRRIHGPEGDAVLRHQVAHLLQIQLTRDESPWWYEAHAIWAEDPRGAAAGLRADAVAAYLDGAARGLESDGIQGWEGSFLWPHYLLASGGPAAVLGAAWEEMAAFPGNNTRQSFEAALQRLRGTGLDEEVRSYWIWNVFLGEMNDGAHYPFAGDLRAPADEAPPSSETFSWSGGQAIAPLGSQVLRLTASPTPGGWWMQFEGDPRVQWDVSLLTIPSWLGAPPGFAAVELLDGEGSAAVPWQDLGGVFLVVQNLGGERVEPSTFRLQTTYDALVPFDLMSFSASEERAGTVSLRWQTEREMDLLGWRIYRSDAPYSGFEIIHPLIIPAIGGPEAAAYLFIDQPPEAGRKYYYLLEGITGLGFREVTYPVSVRLHPTRAAR